MAEPDYYELIGVDRNATLNEIRTKFRQKLRAEHPDKGGDHKKFQLLNKAYNILTDQEKRRHYDTTGRAEKPAEASAKDIGCGRLHLEPRPKDAEGKAVVSPQDGTTASPQTHKEGSAERLQQRDPSAKAPPKAVSSTASSSSFPSSRVPLRVIGLSGLLCEITVGAARSVGEVKQAICKELGVPEGQQRFCLGTEELVDETVDFKSALSNVSEVPVEVTLIRKTQAARLGNLDRIQIPLDQNDEVSCCAGPSGQTPLHVASEFGHVEVVRELLERNADPTIEDSIGQTPLHRAARNGHLPCVRELLLHHAEPGLKDKLGQRAEDLAKAGRHTEIIALLREAVGAQKRPRPRREVKDEGD